MPLPPQKFREAVLQLLYGAEFSEENREETASMLMGELKITKKSAMQAQDMVALVRQKLPEIDPKIAHCSTEYRFDRISSVEKAILRLGMYELFHGSSLPHPIVMAEAIRLARKFGTPESAQFINAILDRAHKEEIQHGTTLCSSQELS